MCSNEEANLIENTSASYFRITDLNIFKLFKRLSPLAIGWKSQYIPWKQTS